MHFKGCVGVVFSFVAAGLSGCTTLPTLDPIDGTKANPDGSISINEVVQRVKCEIYDSTKDVRRDYWWFRYWGAKVDLDLVVNEQSGLTPSVSIIDPWPAVKNGLGTFSQSFTLGLNGGLTSQAVRTESVSFSTTFLEVRDQLSDRVAHNRAKDFRNCNLPQGWELNGNLGLKEWVTSALGPVQGGDDALLTWGGAVAVSSGGGKKPKSDRGAELEKPVSISYTKCRWKPGTPPLKEASCRPPIDSITHTIEFTITKSGGITPSWSLMRFKGQAGNGSLASASRVDTHRLTITLGPSQENLGQTSANQSLRLLAPALTNALTAPR